MGSVTHAIMTTYFDNSLSKGKIDFNNFMEEAALVAKVGKNHLVTQRSTIIAWALKLDELNYLLDKHYHYLISDDEEAKKIVLRLIERGTYASPGVINQKQDIITFQNC